MLDKSYGLWYNGNSARYYPARRAARFVPTFSDGKIPKADWKLIPIGFWFSERRQRTMI